MKKQNEVITPIYVGEHDNIDFMADTVLDQREAVRHMQDAIRQNETKLKRALITEHMDECLSINWQRLRRYLAK